MSNSNLVNYIAKSPNHSGKRTHTIDRITPHCFVGQVTVERIGTAFASSNRKASCNYGIGKDGKVILVVDEINRSWCTSSNANDQRAITIECASDTTEPYAFNNIVYNKLIDLCVDICKRNGKKKILWFADKNIALNYNPKSDEMLLTVHRWFANKSCPGNWLYNRMDDLANKINIKLGAENSSTISTSESFIYTKKDFIKDVQIAIGAKVDGIAGNETLSKTITVSKFKNNKHAVVKPIQKYLNLLGFNCGNADGIAGPKFDNAVKLYQKSKNCIIDGEITAKRDTWKYLLDLK